MKRLITLIALVACVIPGTVFGAGGEIINLEVRTGTGTYTPATATPTYPLKTQFRGVLAAKGTSAVNVQLWGGDGRGMVDPQVTTFTVAANTVYTLSTALPKNFSWFAFRVTGGDAILNTQASIGTGSLYVGEPIASGTVFRWKVEE